MRWLLTEAGASLSEAGNIAQETIWDILYLRPQITDAAEFSSSLKIMVILEDAPADFICRLMPQHAELCE
jgi:hypothetical protein